MARVCRQGGMVRIVSAFICHHEGVVLSLLLQADWLVHLFPNGLSVDLPRADARDLISLPWHRLLAQSGCQRI